MNFSWSNTLDFLSDISLCWIRVIWRIKLKGRIPRVIWPKIEKLLQLDDFGLDRLHQFHWIMHVEKWKKCATHCAVHDPKKAANLKHKLWQQLPQHGEATKHLRIFASQPLLSTYFSRCSLAIHSSGRCFEIADSALWLCFKAAYHREPNAFWILQNKLSKPNLPAIM